MSYKIGMALDVQTLLLAYAQGIFPMAHEGHIYWFDPDPRTILPLDQFHIPRSLQRTLKKRPFELSVNSNFPAVIRACAESGNRRENTWISEEIINAYTHLHHLGMAHSVESWHKGELVGGLYGVALQGLFAGESMFSWMRDASKVALVYLVERLCRHNFLLLDTQFTTQHLHRYGAIEIPRRDYKARLKLALQQNCLFDPHHPPQTGIATLWELDRQKKPPQ